MWDEITYPFPNFEGATVEVWEWISYFIPHFTEHVITYPCWELSLSMLVKGAPGKISLSVEKWQKYKYCQTSNMSRTLVGNIIIDNLDVVGAPPVSAAATTSSLST